MGMGSNMKNNLETLLGYLLEVETVSQRPFMLSLDNLVAHRDSLFDAYEHCVYRNRCSESSGPIVVAEIDDGKYQLIDGYHRLIEHLLDRGGLVPIRAILGGEGTGEYAIARGGDRWLGDASMRYGNLEDLTDEETLEGHANKRKNAKKGDLFENGVSGVSKEALLGKDPLQMSEDEYVDTYFQYLMKLFPQSMHELDNYVPLSRVRIQYDIIPKDRKEDIRFWLKSKTGLEGEPKSAHVRKIGEDGEIREPVILDLRNDFTVEGRHRLAAALKYDLDVPVLLIMDEPQ